MKGNFDSASFNTMRFNKRHNVERKDQAMMVSSEAGELAEAVLKDDRGAVEEEIGDVIFTAVSVALLYDIDASKAFLNVSNENLKKNSSTEGGKVTKDKG